MPQVSEGVQGIDIPAEETAHIFVHPDYRALRGKESPPQYNEDLLQQISSLGVVSVASILLHEPTSAARGGEVYDMFDPDLRFPTDDDIGYFSPIRDNTITRYNETLAEIGVRAAVYHGSYLHQCVWHQIRSMYRRDETDTLFYRPHAPLHDVPPSISLGVVLRNDRSAYTEEFETEVAKLTTEDTKIYSIDDTRYNPSGT